jgi:Fe(3+) dicitrate transport protein
MYLSNSKNILLNIVLILLFSVSVNAESAKSKRTSQSVTTVAQITVIGTELNSVPGSAELITKEDLEISQPQTANEALRRVSGVSIRDEEGLGLRQNISIRGVSGDRSRKILLLEDGVPVSLAPYGENGAYYSPEIERVSEIEVRKGSGSIEYGPQTIGGLINYKTANPPKTREISTKITAGSDDYKAIHYNYGNTFSNNTGAAISVLHKQGNGPRNPMPFMVNDVTAKYTSELNEQSDLTLKFHYYNEDAKVSYLGLSQEQFNSDHKLNPASNDSLYVERLGLSLIHDYYTKSGASIQSVLYGHQIKRDWWRQDYTKGDDNSLGYDTTELDSNGDQLFKDSNGGRNRNYKVVGFEPRFEYKAYKASVKLHYEEERNQRVNGDSATARTAKEDNGLKTDEIRSTLATGAHAQYEYKATSKLTITPGLRIELFDQTRNILKNSSVSKNSTSTGIETEFIPGVGFTYNLNKSHTVYGGAHKGFAPPRFADAIDSDGVDQKLDSERSINYELGLRSKLTKSINTTATVFYYDYQNQIINASTSSGLTKANSGETTSAGVELGLNADNKLKNKSTISSGLSVTYTDAKFNTNLLDGNGNEMATDGNRIPYVSKGSVHGSIGWTCPKEQLKVYLDGYYQTDMYSDAYNTDSASADGRYGTVPAYTVFNLSSSLKVNKSLTVFVSAKNVFNEIYIASRNPEGIMPGNERKFYAGITANF